MIPINSKIILLFPILLGFLSLIPQLFFKAQGIYFLSIALLGLLSHKKQFGISNHFRKLAIYFLIIFAIISYQTIRFPLDFEPILFFFTILLFLVIFSYYTSDSIENYFPVILFYIIFSFSFLLMESKFHNQGRFSGVSLSPTTFAVFTEVFLVITLYKVKDSKIKIILLLLLILLIFLSQTRINIAILPILVVIYLFRNRIYNYRKLVFTLFLITLIFAYPIYEIIQSESALLTSRYDDGVDSSTKLRSLLNYSLLTELSTNSSEQTLFGRGAGFAENYVTEIVKSIKIRPHNDFLRFYADFGFISLILMLVILYTIATRSTLNLSLSLIYLSSFYHNMIYSTFIMLILLYFFTPREKSYN